MQKGTGYCSPCAEHLGRLAFLTPQGRRWLLCWRDRLSDTIAAAGLAPEDARAFED